MKILLGDPRGSTRVDGQTDRQTADMTKLIVIFLNFTNEPNNG